jgi:hypothetical protein
MAKQPRTIMPTAKTGGPRSVHALSQLEQAANVARQSGRVARAAVNVALPGNHRWQLPTQSVLLKNNDVFEAASLANRRSAPAGSERNSGTRPSWRETDSPSNTARDGTVSRRATAIADAARLSRKIPELSHAMDALSLVERSIESGSTGGTALDARKYATLRLAPNSGATSGAPDSLELKRPLFAEASLLSNVRVAPSIRGMIPPANISPREFARPSSDVRASTESGGRSGITINSSPTVVINAPPAGGAVQRDVIGALRAHREELFDQLKREAARRERAQF